MLCGAGLRKMLLFILNESPEAVAAEAGFLDYGDMMLDGSSVADFVEAKYPRNTGLCPLSLYIPPPPSKTSSTKKGLFSHDVTGLGYAIVPIHNDDYSPMYDSHPLVAAYNIGIHAPIVFSFLQAGRKVKESRIPRQSSIIEVTNDKLVEAERKHRRKKMESIKILPEESELTFAVGLVICWCRDLAIGGS